MRRLPVVILILALLGLGISAYTFAYKQSVVSGTFCTINDTFNCKTVNDSPYSEIGGIPVSVIGMIGYGLLAASAFLLRRNPDDEGHPKFLALAATGGLGFSGYLSGVEAFILETWCLLCLASQVVILAIFFLSLYLFVARRRPKSYEEKSSAL